MAVPKQITKKVNVKSQVKKSELKKAPASKNPTKITVKKTKKNLPQTKKTVTKTARKNRAVPKSKVLKKPAAVNSKASKKAIKSELPVSLPNNMSKRAVEKSAVLKLDFDHYFRKSVYKVAYVSSFCFLLVGAALLGSQNIDSTVKDSMSAAVSESTELIQVHEVIPDPTFSLIEPIPAQLNDPYRVVFSVTNATLVETRLFEINKSNLVNLNTEILADSKYRTIVPANSLPPGYYRLKFHVTPLNGKTPRVYESNEFHVGAFPVTEEKVETITQEPIIKETDTTVTSQVTQTEEIKETTSTVNNAEQVTTNDLISIKSPAPLVLPFSLVSPAEKILSGTKVISVSAPKEYTYLELYARPIQSLTPRFVSLASKRLDQWHFVVNSNNLPNGQYEFFARTKKDGKIIDTKSIPLSVSNTALVTTYQREIPIETDSGLISQPVRQLIEVRNVVPEQQIEIVNNDTDRETLKLIKENDIDIDVLLKRYSVAVQSGNEILIKEAQKALENKRESIISSVLQNTRLRDIALDIDGNLTKRIADLQARVNTFEQLRKERSEGSSSIDTDGDGISDYDEVNLYGTNPAAADTDNDGVTDGIEIMRGSNPLDEESEAIIRFESPRDSVGLVREDSLKIKTVSPVIKVEESLEAHPIGTEIAGFGLPNSFVTLFIFSSPTVVTVRTDVDGSFVYTFDKELEDGRHDVYVAVTDNAGKIMAQSNPFSFIKTAEAFTPVDASEADFVTADTVTDSSSNSYKTVIGIAILALGIILLMLGIGLRTKDSDEIVITEKSVTNKEVDTDTNTEETLTDNSKRSNNT